MDLQVELLAHAGVDDLALAARAHQELGDPLEGALGGREADPLRVGAAVLGDQMREALESQREVGAALGLRDRVDLVDDHRLDTAEDVPRLRGHHQVQRLGRRDQDVRRLSQHRLALALRRVARAQPDRDFHVADSP